MLAENNFATGKINYKGGSYESESDRLRSMPGDDAVYWL